MKRPRGGSLSLVLTPDELLARLATLVPPPRIHGVRYHGVFAPNAKARPRVVPQPPEPPPPSAPTPAGASASSSTPAQPLRRLDRRARTYRVPWADLLKRVFAVDVLACPCGGRLQLIAFIAEATVVKRSTTWASTPGDRRSPAPRRPRRTRPCTKLRRQRPCLPRLSEAPHRPGSASPRRRRAAPSHDGTDPSSPLPGRTWRENVRLIGSGPRHASGDPRHDGT